MSALTVDTAQTAGTLAPVLDLWTHGVARKVRGQLAEQEKTQLDAAMVLGLSQPAVNRRMKGHLAFSIVELGILAEWLGLDVTALLPKRGIEVTTPAGSTDEQVNNLRTQTGAEQPLAFVA